MNQCNQHHHEANEPFSVGRAAFRLLFDFSIMISCLKGGLENQRILDVGAGTGWIAEWLNRMGYDVIALDLNKDSSRFCRMRVACDQRVNPNLIHFQCGDAHDMPYKTSSFGHICCFDTLHHMRDYSKVLSEFYRVLIPDGRAIFVEPGAKHSSSKETIEFIEKYKNADPTWMERDVVMEEINRIAIECGFSDMTIRPALTPDLREYDLALWQKFRQGDQTLATDYLDWLKQFNYDSRVIFYLDKGSSKKKTLSVPLEKAMAPQIEDNLATLLDEIRRLKRQSGRVFRTLRKIGLWKGMGEMILQALPVHGNKRKDGNILCPNQVKLPNLAPRSNYPGSLLI